MLFQQFQRYIHGQTSLDDYINFSREILKIVSIFRFIPVMLKFSTSTWTLSRRTKGCLYEWLKIGDLLNLLKDKVDFVRICDLEITDNEVEVSFNIPNLVFVKKQDKYNLARWSPQVDKIVL